MGDGTLGEIIAAQEAHGCGRSGFGSTSPQGWRGGVYVRFSSAREAVAAAEARLRDRAYDGAIPDEAYLRDAIDRAKLLIITMQNLTGELIGIAEERGYRVPSPPEP